MRKFRFAMIKNIIGRERELGILRDAFDSPEAELIAVYGRRRIGKTFLIKEFFDGEFDFYATGIYQGKQKEELIAFTDAFRNRADFQVGNITDWMGAFYALREFLSGLKKKKIVVFLDELPWFDVPPGRFLKAFEWFWNSWGSTRKGLKLIVCGSATSWMTNKFISSKGGLFNRITRRIHLSQFNLYESKLLLNHNGIDWPDGKILETYMVFGGVPYYLNMIDRRLSLDANVDKLFFSEDAPLTNEYEFIVKSLFRDADYYMGILAALAEKNMGSTRKEIVEKARITDNGFLSKALKNLIDCGFIRRYSFFGKKEKDMIYQLTDLFMLFHKRFVARYNGKDDTFWRNMIDNPRRRSWSGIAFEQVSLLHLSQIKAKLGISGVLTDTGGWFFQGNEETPGCQIDMVISRRDKVINICEMKYSTSEFAITKKYAGELQQKVETFREITKTRHALHLTMITPDGLKTNSYSYIPTNTITLFDLMKN